MQLGQFGPSCRSSSKMIHFPRGYSVILSLENPTKTRNKRTLANMQPNPDRQCRRICLTRDMRDFIAPHDGQCPATSGEWENLVFNKLAGAWRPKPHGQLLFVNTKIRTRKLFISRLISAAKLSRYIFMRLLSPEEVKSHIIRYDPPPFL